MEYVEGNNTSSWHDSDKFPGQTCGLEGICVLCGLEMGCLFPCLWRQAVATMEIIDSRNLDDSLSHCQTIHLATVGSSCPDHSLLGCIFYFLYIVPQKEVKQFSYNWIIINISLYILHSLFIQAPVWYHGNKFPCYVPWPEEKGHPS